ncbi:hypothetical protein CRUP_005368 [Coryphaenoides rupestris]|nr:hypothetical protein CRUP_005368 [Coryphaenoides rupestris]
MQSTAHTFIILFLIALVYGIGTTAIKLPNLSVMSSVDAENASFSCFAVDFSPKEYTITWLRNEEKLDPDQILASSDGLKSAHGTFYSAASYIKVDESLWKDVDTVITCMFSDREKSKNASLSYTTPTTCIRKKKAALICEVTVQGIADLDVAWYNESDNKPLQTLSNGKKTTTTATITYDEWSKGMKWYCSAAIKDSITPPKRKSFEKINVERVVAPNITLYPIWRGPPGASQLSLVCTLSGFYPDKLSVVWLLDDPALTTTPVQDKLQSAEGVEKTFNINSQIQLKIEEWKRGPTVQCKATHNGDHEETQKVSICATSVHLTTPSFQTVMSTGSDVTATCVIHTAFDIKLNWLLDGKGLTSSNKVDQTKEDTLTSNNLTVSVDKWKTLNSITWPTLSSPSVLIRRYFPSVRTEEDTFLECAITKLSSSDLCVTFQANGEDISEKMDLLVDYRDLLLDYRDLLLD